MPRGAPPGMAREYDFYMQLHELQPPAPRYHYDISHTNPGAASAYELTVGPGAACEAPLSLHDPRRQQTGGERYEMRCEAQRPAPAPPVATLTSATTKRKSSSFTGSVYEDDGGDDSRSSRTAPDKRQNHSEIEKRRRDKMNTYISELAAMVPMCGAMARKLDKLTVLRMAVQYLRTIKGYLSAGPLTTRPWPAFLTEREQNALILQAAHDCFLLVVGCDRGRVLYLSASVKKMLYYEQNELLGQSLFDILHPKDVAKVKEQLSSSDLSPRDRLIDAKTMLPVKVDMVAGASRLCPGARRSFFCRIKCKAASDSTTVKEDPEPSCKHRKKYSEKKYCVVQCTGYLKSWAPAEISESAVPEGGEESDTCQLSCLVGVGRALPDLTPPTFEPHSVPLQPLQFTSRHATDGKFLFVDQRVTLALGFLPQELLGTSLYEYVNDGELSSLARAHKIALQTREPLHTPTYSFRKKDGSFAWIRTHFKPFRNPWTKDLECLVANNTVIRRNHSSPFPEEPGSYEMFKQSSEYPAEEQEMERLIDTQMESHKIGNAIAEEALRSSSAEFSPELQPKAAFSQQSSLVDDMLSVELGDYDHVRNNVPLSSVGAQSPPPPEIVLPTSPPPVSPPLPPLGLDGNGEAAIAVIMSLLEADAGLGGPINFSGLPWPLP